MAPAAETPSFNFDTPYAANIAATTADTTARINALMAAERAADAAAETAANDAAIARQDAFERETRETPSTAPTGTDLTSGNTGDSGYTGGNFGDSTSDNNDSVGRGDSDSGGDSDGGGNDSGGGGGGDARGGYLAHGQFDQRMARGGNVHGNLRPPHPFFQDGKYSFHPPQMYADGGLPNPYNLGSYSDGGRLLKGPGDGVSDSIPATIGKGRPARLADGEFVIPARIVSEIGNGSTEAGARKLYAMMDRIQAGRKKSVGKGKVAVNSRADKYLPV